jgi:alkylation response protein AidB-like acyl-CoA dehydrogenase
MNGSRMSETEWEIVEALADVLAKEAALPGTLQAAASPAGYDRDVQATLAGLGFFGVCSPAAVGGLGLAPHVLGEFCVEAGRVLLGGPWFEQLLAAQLLGAAGDGSLLSDLIAGRATVSLPLDGAIWRRPPAVRIEGADARFVAGRCEIGFATSVDCWLVPAEDVDTGALVLVKVSPAAATCHSRRSWSELWRSHDVELTDAVGLVVAELPAAAADQHVAQTARLLAFTSVGATEALLATTVEFLKLREQFGRPLGSFQALQHMMANVFIDLEHTRSLVRASFDPLDGDALQVAVAMAKVAADRLAVGAAESALQAHGGLGFTWELPVHHFLKEALRRRTLPAPSASYRDDLCRRVKIL